LTKYQRYEYEKLLIARSAKNADDYERKIRELAKKLKI